MLLIKSSRITFEITKWIWLLHIIHYGPSVFENKRVWKFAIWVPRNYSALPRDPINKIPDLFPFFLIHTFP